MSRLQSSDKLMISSIIRISDGAHSASAGSVISQDLRKIASVVDLRKAIFEKDNSYTSWHSGLKCNWINNLPVMPDRTPVQAIHLFAKRLVDITISGLALLVLSPIFLIIALAIKINTPGPVFFCQNRVGYKRQVFNMYKFRTMHHHRRDESGVEQTDKDDCRVTGFGRLLRKTSIDELPQLINIFKGEMSLVGPRPFVPGQMAAGLPYRKLVSYYDLRYSVVPGLTGWAQANGLRGPTKGRELSIARIEHDMAYIQNRSLWLDTKILFITVWHEFVSGSGH